MSNRRGDQKGRNFLMTKLRLGSISERDTIITAEEARLLIDLYETAHIALEPRKQTHRGLKLAIEALMGGST